MSSNQHIRRGARESRFGRTTGTCAALAAGAAADMLLGGRPPGAVSLTTPAGVAVEVDLVEAALGPDSAVCAVRKDAGDDPDVTDGVLLRATARKTDRPGIDIEGGAGVGRVTRPGLDQPVGAAAINSVPRRMIREEVEKACRIHSYRGGMSIVISIPGGAELAARTFNPRLGIEGGLSIIGTSGLVEPMSGGAILGTIRAELNMHRAEGAREAVLTPGNYGMDFVRARPAIAGKPAVKCANHIGAALDLAAAAGYTSILLVGHAGKLIKVAGGVMDTHSSVADCRLELLALHAVLAGAGGKTAAAVFNSATVDAGLEIVEAEGLLEQTLAGLLERIDRHLARRTGSALACGAVLFSKRAGLLGTTGAGAAILSRWEAERQDWRNGTDE